MPDHANTHSKDSAYKKRSLFGRRQGRALKGERSRVLDEVLPQFKIPEDKLTENQDVQPSDILLTSCSEYWLEIGFGHGEHVAGLLQKHPENGYLAAEPFVNGMSSFLKEYEDDLTQNLRVLMDDGMIIARSLKPNSLDGIYVLNPDPWHKKRHHKRRIIRKENLDILSKILKPGGKLILTTDVPDLAEWMFTHTFNHPDFIWSAKTRTDWDKKPHDWITTKYEEKGAKGAQKMVYLFFERK